MNYNSGLQVDTTQGSNLIPFGDDIPCISWYVTSLETNFCVCLFVCCITYLLTYISTHDMNQVTRS